MFYFESVLTRKADHTSHSTRVPLEAPIIEHIQVAFNQMAGYGGDVGSPFVRGSLHSTPPHPCSLILEEHDSAS